MSAQRNNILCQIKNALDDQAGGGCDDPIHVVSCDPTADMVDVDTQLVCNSDTGVYDTHVITITNGVAADPVITPTTISCAEPDTPPDIEQVRVCDEVTGTYHVVTTAFDADGTETELSDIDTGQTCGQTINHTTVRECRNGTIHAVTRSVDETNTITEIEAVDTGEVCDEPPTPVVEADVEYVCNADTGFWDAATTTSIDGVPAPSVNVPTTISCAEGETPPDYETVVECRDGVATSVTYAITVDGTQTELQATGLAYECGTTLNHTTVRECRGGTIWAVTRSIDETGTVTEIDAVDTGETCDEPTETADVELVCNADSGVYDLATTPIVDGVTGETVYTPTELSCAPDEPPLDVELIDRCIDGTIHQLTVAFDGEGAETVLADVDTVQDCYQGQPDCVKWSAIYVQVDNTGTSFTESHEITLTNSDGTTTVLNVAAQAGWSQQITEWAAQLDAAYGGTFDPRCTFLPNGCGGLLPPPPDSPPQKGIFARYVQGVFCPTDKVVPIAAEVTDSSNPARIGRKLVLHVVEGPEYRGQVCRTCADGAGELQFEDGTPVPEADLPVCFFSCAESIPVPPTAACEFDAFEAGCDNIGEPDDNTNWVTVTRILSICEGVTTVDYYVADPDDPTALIDHILVGDYVDCETGEPIPEPEPVEDCGCLYDLVVPAGCDETQLALPVTDQCLETKIDTLIETQTATNDLLTQLIECLCGPCDDDLGEPLGDQVACASEKLGADFVSNATGEGTHTTGSLYTGTGPLTAWAGTFTVTDSAGTTHTFNDGDMLTGIASGSTTSVTFTGQIEFIKDGETFRCPVTDKAISANFTVL